MTEFFSAIGGFIMTPLYYLISGVLLAWHKVWSTVLDPASGAAWVLSIIGLTVVIRALLIPLFVKQIKSSRNLQILQPQVRELQKKYAHDREKLTQETMKLYRETGTNPFSSCLPILVQIPIFFALFRVIDVAAKKEKGRGFLTDAHAHQLAEADLFGGRISETFLTSEVLSVKIVAIILIVAMTLTTFLTQRQLMAKNMPPEAMQGPMAQQMKIMLYVLPLVFAVSGVYFPIGVIIYWTTSNLWTMGQQYYVIRNNPAPNTEAARAKEARDAAKAARKGGELPPAAEDGATQTEAPPAARQQPKRQSRRQRNRGKGRGGK